MDNPLKEIPGEVWDMWLTVLAECLAPAGKCADCIYAETVECDLYAEQCLFCDAFENNCEKCDPGGYEFCKTMNKGERLDRAISRLEDEDIFVERRQCGYCQTNRVRHTTRHEATTGTGS